MSNSVAHQFIEALGRLEQSRDLDSIAGLFTEDAEIGNVIAPEKFHGTAGARDFWTKYRDSFETLKSTFRNQILGEGRIALEWTTKGKIDGNDVDYEGVSIIELEGEKIKRFRAYFDPTALTRFLQADSATAAR